MRNIRASALGTGRVDAALSRIFRWGEGMTDRSSTVPVSVPEERCRPEKYRISDVVLPHHRYVAYQVAVELVLAVKEARISDAKLRDEALRAAKGAVLNIVEAVGRVSRADKARVFGIARGEATEVVAAVELSALLGEAEMGASVRCVELGGRLIALLTGLMR